MKKMDEMTRESIYCLIAWIDDVEKTRPLFHNLCELLDRFQGEEE
jgi:hypothetical protein